MKPPETVLGEQNYLEQLLNLSRTLNSSLKLEVVLETAIESVVEFLVAERGFIMLFDDDENLKVRASKNVDPVEVERYEGISRTVIKAASIEGKNVLSADAQKDPGLKALASVQLTGMRSVLCVPLQSRERIIGVIYLDNNFQEGMFNEKHLGMLEAFANQAAGAIENARLHEKELRLQEELYQQEKRRLASEEANQLKTDFVNIVSHELKSPLTVIKALAYSMHRDLSKQRNRIPDTDKLEYYETIDREVDRLLSMISRLLDVSAIDAGKPLKLHTNTLDIGELIDEVVKLETTSKFFKPGRHTIKKQVPKNLPQLNCDDEKLKQILINLLGNAFKYSPDGGEVKISITCDDDSFYFEISDQGLGISPEGQKKLFGKFERLDTGGRTIPGTGLGLYLIKNLVEVSGGKINVRSTPGKGSTFYFTIPTTPPC